ncbi:MAG: protein kinase [Candidatus Eisenbacteria bacterium]
MTLAPGTKLGPYEIVAPLGAGGMGEVYRARDTRLGRDVAIKVLPQHLSANAEVRARFEREARTVSSLNHPNICTLFDVGREGETDYLVMELVEGETLSQRLLKGALPIADVLRLGAQIADALDRAHRAGVVHRDLKPGNVMVTRSGAKLMDFGLARATAAAGPVSGSGATMAALTQHPTVASPLTAEGAIVGTFQYMSPEQLEGREADTRSDLWALGCVLYEMATGRRAFEGRSQASLITAIMGSQPAPLVSLAPMSPPALERLVNALLAKDADDRIQTAHDVRLQLGWMGEAGSQVASGVSAAGAASVAAGARRAGAPAWVLPALALLALAAGALVGSRWFRAPEATTTTQVPLPKGMRLPDYWTVGAISPDGRTVVAVSASDEATLQQLWLLPLERVAPSALPQTAGGMQPCWSPDGRSLAYFDTRQKLVSTVSVAGGAPARLCPFVDPRGLTWGKQGVIVFAPTPTGGLSQVAANGGAVRPATVLDSTRGEVSHRFPSFLPDGEHFLFTVLPAGPEGFPIHVGSIRSTSSHEVLRAESGALCTPSGRLLFVRGGKLMAQDFDLRALKTRGAPVTIGDASPPGDMDGELPASASADGKLVLPWLPTPISRLEWLDRRGAPVGTVPVPESDWIVRSVSQDGRTALVTGNSALWQVDLERGVPTRLLDHVDPVEMAVFSPDGRRVAATAKQDGREDVVLMNVGGGGAREASGVKGAVFQEAAGWAPDGSLLVSALVASGTGAQSSWDLWRVPAAGAEPERYTDSAFLERRSALSADGRWVAYMGRAQGRLDLIVDSWPRPGQRFQVFSGAALKDDFLFWGRGGDELIYVDAEYRVMSVPLELGANGPRAGTPARLFEVPSGFNSLTTADGERFLVARDKDPSNGTAILLVQHWEGLMRK